MAVLYLLTGLGHEACCLLTLLALTVDVTKSAISTTHSDVPEEGTKHLWR
jgi:hypothetical protein